MVRGNHRGRGNEGRLRLPEETIVFTFTFSHRDGIAAVFRLGAEVVWKG